MEEKNLPDRADEIITEVLNNDALILASISTIPYFGSTLATFYSAKRFKIFQERTNSMLDEFREALNELNERTVRKDYFDTDEGTDLLIKATEHSARTGDDRKRALIARILAGATSSYSQEGNYTPEEYINIVGSLTPKELEVARTIYDLQQEISSPRELEPENKAETWSLCAERIIQRHAVEPNDLPLLLNRLYTVGLLDLFYVLVPGSPIPTYWVSPAFERLMEFLSLNPHSHS